MKSNVAALFLLLSLSITVIQVRCNNEKNDDTLVVDASPLGEDGNTPDFNQNNLVQCADTEEYSACNGNPICQRTCDNLNLPGIACPRKSCIEGCICKTNFVRSELYGGCIPKDQCGRVKY